MIVISGALVLVALVLLVLGLFDSELDFVYASIAVSLAAFVFLIIGIIQRRGEGAPEAVAEVSLDDRFTEAPRGATIVSAPGERDSEADAADEAADASADDEAAVSGQVLVVAGRPRYHVGGCRYLAEKPFEEVPVLDARAEGFTPCGVCKPDVALATASQAVEDVAPAAEELPAPTQPVRRGSATARRASRDEPATASVKAIRKTAAVRAPAKTAGKTPTTAAKAAKATTAKATTAKAPSQAAKPAKATTPKATTPKAAASAPRVVVIPDRGKFHTAECRFVRGVDGTQELTRAQAARQGFDACGVCKP